MPVRWCYGDDARLVTAGVIDPVLEFLAPPVVVANAVQDEHDLSDAWVLVELIGLVECDPLRWLCRTFEYHACPRRGWAARPKLVLQRRRNLRVIGARQRLEPEVLGDLDVLHVRPRRHVV